MLKKAVSFLYFHELLLGVVGFTASFLFYVFFPGPITLWRALPGVFSWVSVFLLGDWLSRKLGEGSLLPQRKNQLSTFKKLMAAALVMNLISDMTGSWLLKLWYYPLISDPVLYILVLAPLGYILFGLILYVFYRLFKHHWDYFMKPGRLSRFQKKLFTVIMHGGFVGGIIGLYVSVTYYADFVRQHEITWYVFDRNVVAEVNLGKFILLWVSLFFLLEYACFLLKRETLTRDLIRGNVIPLLSIFLASIVCIVLVEFFNAPFQVWTFTNWPYDSLSLFKIPLLAYICWPLQYLLLLPIIRLFDTKNTQNLW